MRCADSAAGARAVFDQHALAQLCIELGRQRTGKGIGAAAGRERHDEGDRLVRPCLGLGYVLGLAGHSGNDRDKCKQGAPDNSCFHGIFLRLIASVRRQRRNCFFSSRFRSFTREDRASGRTVCKMPHVIH